MPSLPKPGEVKIFSTQLLSTGSLGHTLVAYMPSHSWPLHRHTCTNDLIKTCAFEVRILTVSHTHACPHTHARTALLTDESQSSAACLAGWKVLSEQRSVAFIFSVSDLSMRLIHVTCMRGAAWKYWITAITCWQQKRKIHVVGFWNLHMSKGVKVR